MIIIMIIIITIIITMETTAEMQAAYNVHLLTSMRASYIVSPSSQPSHSVVYLSICPSACLCNCNISELATTVNLCHPFSR